MAQNENATGIDENDAPQPRNEPEVPGTLGELPEAEPIESPGTPGDMAVEDDMGDDPTLIDEDSGD